MPPTTLMGAEKSRAPLGTVTVTGCTPSRAGATRCRYLRAVIILLKGHQHVPGDVDFLLSVDLLGTDFPAGGCTLPWELSALPGAEPGGAEHSTLRSSALLRLEPSKASLCPWGLHCPQPSTSIPVPIPIPTS